MKIWTGDEVRYRSALVTPFWVNVDDLQNFADTLDDMINRLERITPGNAVHHSRNISTVLGAWRDRLRKASEQ